MSTRRARIKAVASLPVRRKNNDNAESSKSKPESVVTECLPGKETPKERETSALPVEDKVNSQTPSSPLVRPAVESFASPRRSQRAVVTPNLIERSPLTPKIRKPVTPRPAASPKNVNKTSIVSSKRSPVVSIISTSIDCDNQSDNLASRNEPNNVANSDSTNVANSELNQPVATPEVPKINYNPPSIPESITEEAVIDGIVPLQSQSASKPKPIDLWKNEIISENAEVLFDPIVPLPSPSKVRPKLRPVPRLPLRRNSVQGSASESEDESRRALLSVSGQTTPGPRQRHDSQTLPQLFLNKDISRVRTDSINSTTSHMTGQTSHIAASPLKEKQKIRRSEMNRKMQALRRKQRRDMPMSRDTLTMYDLIFYNPLNNPIVHEDDNSTTVPIEPEPEADKTDNNQNTDPDDPPPQDEQAVPVPQIKLGPNGEIMLDEQSLVIKQTEPDRALSKSVVHENEWANSGRGKYNRAKRSADWSNVETVRFYRALAAVGTDFTLMAPMFPTRTRKELKVKFKKEEKVNGAQIDKALRSQTQWDALYLQEEFAKERKLAAEMEEKARLEYNQQKQAEKERVRASRGFRQSRACKAVSQEVIPGFDDKISTPLIAQDIVNLSTPNIKPRKPRTPATSARRLVTKPNEIGNINLIRNTTPTQMRTPSQPVTKLPRNIESGSLVVLTVNDPNEPSKKMLQTYISNNGQLTPVALPPNLLGSVMDYMKRGTPSTVSAGSSPQVPSPSSVASQESRSSVIHINPSPHKKQRHNSYTITQL